MRDTDSYLSILSFEADNLIVPIPQVTPPSAKEKAQAEQKRAGFGSY